MISVSRKLIQSHFAAGVASEFAFRTHNRREKKQKLVYFYAEHREIKKLRCHSSIACS